MQMGESSSSSLLGSVINVSQDRDGVRIDAPHGWEINDVHHQWTKNETYHYETGNVFHLTSGQVLHTNLNTAEVHTTANVLTMHVDMTPIQVHINRNLIGGIRFHYEPNIRTRSYHYHHGHFVNLNSSSATEAGEIELHASQKIDFSSAPQLSSYMAVLSAAPPTTGKMTLKADGEMNLHSKENIKIVSGTNRKTSLSFTTTEAALDSETVGVFGGITLLLCGGSSNIELENDKITLMAGSTSCVFDKTANAIAANARSVSLNGKVMLGNPSASASPSRRQSIDESKSDSAPDSKRGSVPS